MYEIFSLGNNLATQLGIGHSIGESHTLNRIKFPIDFVDETKGEKTDQLKVVTGTLHSLVLYKNRLYSFGCNDEGALGRDEDEEYPKMVCFPSSTKTLPKIKNDTSQKINEPNTKAATKEKTDKEPVNKNKEITDKKSVNKNKEAIDEKKEITDKKSVNKNKEVIDEKKEITDKKSVNKNKDIRRSLENTNNNENVADNQNVNPVMNTMESITDDQIVGMGCGQSSSFVLTKSGLLYGWGLFRDSSGPIGFLMPEYATRVNKNKARTIGNKPGTTPRIDKTVKSTISQPARVPRTIGKLKCVTYSVKRPVLLSKNVQAMSVGANHVLYKKPDGIYSIGNNLHGEKGVKPNRRISKLEQLKPVLVANRRSALFNSGKFQCGNETSFFFADEKVFCCGNNLVGQLGIDPISTFQKRKFKLTQEKEPNNSLTDDTKQQAFTNEISSKKVVATQAKELPESSIGRRRINEEKEFIEQIATGETHALFLTNKGDLYGSGNNSFGQLTVNESVEGSVKQQNESNGQATGSIVFSLRNVHEVRANGFFSYVKINVVWYSFGFASSGELLGREGDDDKLDQVTVFDQFTVQNVELGHGFVLMTGSVIKRIEN